MAIITISRGTFSGGQSLAECVARRLGYCCVSREILVQAAKRYGISEERLCDAINEPPGVWERLQSERKRYLACLRAELIREVKEGNVVYHGNAGHFLLEGVPKVLRVRIVASMEFRIRSLTEHRNVSREEAIRFIRMVDEKRAKWTQFLYHVDWRDPSLYDLVVNIDQISLSGACDIVCHTVDLEPYRETSESRKRIGDMELSSDLEAIIFNARDISGGKKVRVAADSGVVTLEGTVESPLDADRVRILVRKNPGVTQIDSRMKVRLFGVYTGKNGKMA